MDCHHINPKTGIWQVIIAFPHTFCMRIINMIKKPSERGIKITLYFRFKCAHMCFCIMLATPLIFLHFRNHFIPHKPEILLTATYNVCTRNTLQPENLQKTVSSGNLHVAVIYGPRLVSHVQEVPNLFLALRG